MSQDGIRVGAVVEVSQQIPQRDDVWSTQAIGTVVEVHQDKTGSWFAHAKDDKLWLDRLTLQTEDGEFVDLVLDQYSHVRVVQEEAHGELEQIRALDRPGLRTAAARVGCRHISDAWCAIPTTPRCRGRGSDQR